MAGSSFIIATADIDSIVSLIYCNVYVFWFQSPRRSTVYSRPTKSTFQQDGKTDENGPGQFRTFTFFGDPSLFQFWPYYRSHNPYTLRRPSRCLHDIDNKSSRRCLYVDVHIRRQEPLYLWFALFSTL